MEILDSLQKVKLWQDSVNPEIIDTLRNSSVEGKARIRLNKQILRLQECGKFLTLREWLEHDNQVTLKKGNFCMNHIMCRTCAIRRSQRVIAAYHEKIDHVLTENPLLIPVMITLSLKNTDDLDEGILRIRKAMSRMMLDRRRHRNDPRNAPNEWTKVVGSIKALEVTNKGRGWHPHVHVLALIDTYIDQRKLSREWQRYTGDSYIVDVRKLTSVEEGLYEVLKYVTKFGDLKPSQIANLHLSLGGKRLIDPQGILRGVKVPESLDDVDLDGPYREFYALWNKRGWLLIDESLKALEEHEVA